MTSTTTKQAYDLVHSGLLAFSRAEQAGIRVDVPGCVLQKERITRHIARLEWDFQQTDLWRHWSHVYGPKASVGSDYQLAHMLYAVRKIEPPNKTVHGRGSTDAETLEALGMPELALLVEKAKLEKLRDTYLDAFVREQVDGVLHPFFNLHTVRSYRSSSDHPNWQNNPKRDEEARQVIGRVLFPRPGHQFVDGDYKGVEVSMACCYTEDPKLIEDAVRGDMHKDMAVELYMLDGLDKGCPGEYALRQGGKNGFVFPEFYGDYYGNCAAGLIDWAKRGSLRDGTPALVHLSDKGLVRLGRDGSVLSFDKFTEHVRRVEDQFWNVRYRVYQQWKEWWWAQYQKRGYFDMFTGFRCSGVMSQKEVCNYPFQGSAFHCLLQSFVWLDAAQRKRQWDSRLIGQIHDQVNWDAHPDERDEVVRTMLRVSCDDLRREWKWIIVPLSIDVEIGRVDGPWCDKKPYKLEEVA